MRRNEALEHLIQPFVPFLANPATTEIVVNRPGEFGVEANGQWSWHTEESLTFDRLDAIGVLTAFRASREFDPSLKWRPPCPAASDCRRVVRRRPFPRPFP